MEDGEEERVYGVLRRCLSEHEIGEDIYDSIATGFCKKVNELLGPYDALRIT